ncbi:hypothetical protein N0V94_002731 [Neodidymelliopsis sp. IMI 364377]|nr:hypothetical protein N0V94_002731 [Neodidymelliopsis sp. IMI 364377]
MLAELRGLEGTSRSTKEHTLDEGHIEWRRLLTELERPASPVLTTTSLGQEDDPRRMLAELASLASVDRDADMPTSEDSEEDIDVEVLRARIEDLRSHMVHDASQTEPNRAEPGTTIQYNTRQDIVGDSPALPCPVTISYAIALQLEHSACQWEYAQEWTRFLFSSGLDGYEAQQHQDLAVLRAENSLKRIVEDYIEVEQRIRQREEDTKLQRRLVVSNLAAGADEQALYELFRKYHHQIDTITFLPDRDPLRRTQTAHIDMSSKETAMRASYLTGAVYGLIVDIRLAVEKQEEY